METKQQIIDKIKKEVKPHAQPRQIQLRSKQELQELYDEAVSVGAING